MRDFVIHLWRAGRRGPGVFFLLPAAIFASGCGEKSAPPAPAPVEPRPAQGAPEKKRQPLPVSGVVQGLDLTITDENGVLVARVKAKTGAVGQSGAAGGAAGALRESFATLFEKGKPVATLEADQIDADPATRIITGTGSVVVRSLAHTGSPTVRTDTAAWRHGENTIRGEGNVLITRDGVRIPGKSFVADTKLRRVTVQGNGGPITGRFQASGR
jgi:hypothetical protein